MSAGLVRMLKEGRALLVPWCAVMAVCALAILKRVFDLQGDYLLFSQSALFNLCFAAIAFIGIPMLSCLSFGNEFRHKTMDLLMSQPADRMKIWREKWVVTILASVSAALVVSFSWGIPFHADSLETAFFIVFFVVTTCSAAFWTLLARSTLGGLALNIAAFIPLFFSGTGPLDWNSTAGYLNRTFLILILSAAAVGYSGFMLWLGQRMLVHRQSRGGLAGPDLMTALPSFMPDRVSALFRSDPNHVVLNLIRKELRLLQPLWLLSVLYILCWISMAISFSFVPASPGWQRSELVVLVMVAATFPVVAIFLAASISLGEERAIGVQAWHMTLPLALRSQWLIRFLTALTAGLFCAVAIPAMLTALGRVLLRAEFVMALARETVPEPAIALLMFFLFAFWCAVIVRDMTRTAGLAVAAGAMSLLSIGAGYWITDQVIGLINEVFVFAVSRRQLNPYFFTGLLNRIPNFSHTPGWIFAAIFFVAMTVHSYFLFRRLPEEGLLKVLRPVVPYLVAILVCQVFISGRTWNRGNTPAFTFSYDLYDAIVKLQPDASKFDNRQSIALGVDDLARASALPERTQRWLRNSTVTLSASDPDADSDDRWKMYNLTIHLAGGTNCQVSYSVSRGKLLDTGHFALLQCDPLP